MFPFSGPLYRQISGRARSRGADAISERNTHRPTIMRTLLLALPLASGFTLTTPRPTVTNRATTVMMPEMANGKMQVSFARE